MRTSRCRGGGSQVANEGQAVVQPIAELLVAMEQAAAELEAAATEQPAVEQLEVLNMN